MAYLNQRLGRLAATMAVTLVLAGLVPGVTSAAAAAPKVAIIVGPAGASITENYRQAADAAAAVAESLTPNVVKVYSPDATWPAVKAAVTGAAVVVYLGHGNGWPSRYSSTLQGRTMDGFGLNPVGGVDDVAHQYFGESFISKLHLAQGAVVLLSHLCYASGSTEPGLADGTFSDVLSRVDNFASGFLSAGAGAVIAEGHQGPAALMAAALRGPLAASRAWQSASWGHNHMATFASTRVPGAAVSLDPDTANTGYYRSLVQAPGAVGRTILTTPAPVQIIKVGPPSLVSAGAKFGSAVVQSVVAPGATTAVQLPVTSAAKTLPSSLIVGVRWLPLVAPSTPDATTTDGGLVVGEANADVVDTASATRSGSSLKLGLSAPTTPGTYVVLLTLETADGTPYDVATQALLRPFTVVVPKPIDLRITGPSLLTSQPGVPVSFDVALENTGTQAWGSSLYASIWNDPALDPALDASFSKVLSLRANWLNTATGVVTPAASYPLPRQLGAPGGSTNVHLNIESPATDGQYLLVLSMAVQGDLGEFPQTPLLISSVISGDAPSATPAPAPSASPSASPVAPAPSAPVIPPVNASTGFAPGATGSAHS